LIEGFLETALHNRRVTVLSGRVFSRWASCLCVFLRACCYFSEFAVVSVAQVCSVLLFSDVRYLDRLYTYAFTISLLLPLLPDSLTTMALTIRYPRPYCSLIPKALSSANSGHSILNTKKQT
jgi:hypothetical protein